LFILVFVVVLNFSFFKPQDNLGRGDDYYLTRYTTLNGTSPEYKSTKEEYLRLPENSEARPATLYPDFYGDNIIVLSNTKMNLLEYKALVKSNGGVVSVNKYYFPGWEVYINDKKESLKLTQNGRFAFPVSRGKNKAEIVFNETLIRKVSAFISITSLGLMIALLISKRFVTIKK